MKTLVSLILLALCVASQAKTFGQCELASLLKSHGLDGYYGISLANWVCMAYHESRYITDAYNDNGPSRDYGIFQINSQYWCDDYRTPGTVVACGIPCSSLMDDDISNDITCAKRVIQDPNGMGAWVAWNNYCKNKDVSGYVSGCGV